MPSHARSVAALLCLVATSCVYSIDAPSAVPVEIPSDLLGTWGDPEGEQVTFGRASRYEYILQYVDGDGATGSFIATELRLGERRLLDVVPAELPADLGNEAYRSQFLPLHAQLIIELNDDELIMRVFDNEAIADLWESQPGSIHAMDIGGNIVLTDEDAALAAFLTGLLMRPDADEFLGEPAVLRRVP